MTFVRGGLRMLRSVKIINCCFRVYIMLDILNIETVFTLLEINEFYYFSFNA